jgi:hypothetical protein
MRNRSDLNTRPDPPGKTPGEVAERLPNRAREVPPGHSMSSLTAQPVAARDDMRSQSRTELCPRCHRPWPEERLGVPLTPLKVRIFDAIRRAGLHGIAGDAIIQELGLPVSRTTLKSHINERLAESGHRIVGRGGYRVQSLPRHER